MRTNEFKTWLEKKLQEPFDYSYLDMNRDSHRAVAKRGLFKEIIYQYKNYPSYISDVLRSFSGLSTPVGYFIHILLIITLFPILPIIWGSFCYRETIKFYKEIFEETKLTKCESDDRDNRNM